MFYLNFVGLSFAPPPKCVIKLLKRTGDDCKNSRWWYLDPKREKTRFSNQFLYACCGEVYPSMGDKNFEAYFFKGRKERFERHQFIEQTGKRLDYCLSENPSQLSFHLSNSSEKVCKPTDIEMIERHVKTIEKDGEKISEEIKSIQQRNDLIYRNNSLRKGIKEQKEYNDNTLTTIKEILDRISNAEDGAEKELAKLKELFAGKTTSKSKLMKKRSKKENKCKTKAIAWKRLEKATRIFINKYFGSGKFEEAFPMGVKNKTSEKMFTEKDVITQKMKRNKTDAKVFRLLSRKDALTKECREKLILILKIEQAKEGKKISVRLACMLSHNSYVSLFLLTDMNAYVKFRNGRSTIVLMPVDSSY